MIRPHGYKGFYSHEVGDSRRLELQLLLGEVEEHVIGRISALLLINTEWLDALRLALFFDAIELPWHLAFLEWADEMLVNVDTYFVIIVEVLRLQLSFVANQLSDVLSRYIAG